MRFKTLLLFARLGKFQSECAARARVTAQVNRCKDHLTIGIRFLHAAQIILISDTGRIQRIITVFVTMPE